VREDFEIIALQTKASLIPTLLPGGEGLFQIIPDSNGRRPESSVFNQPDTGLRRCDDLFGISLTLLPPMLS
jgi:hypothetical protein